MALKLRSLVLLGSSPHTQDVAAHKLFLYATADAASVVLTDGYFNDARGQLSVNDTIMCMAVVGGVGDRLDLKVLTVPASGNVTTAANASASGS
jgi:hypothetical protein